MALLKALVGLVLVILLVIGGIFVYNNYFSGKIEHFGKVSSGDDAGANMADVSSDIEQFYANMRFNHNKISYYINPECNEAKEARMKSAFSIVEGKTGNLLAFYPDSEENAEILIGCSADSYEKEVAGEEFAKVFIAGEGGPTKITNSSMPVIMRGKILLYNEKLSDCSLPLLEIHELFHVFGYDHINEPKNIMYPYLNCEQEINQSLIEHIKKLYAIAPFADLYLSNINANQERYAGKWYLNFNLSIDNYGIIDAKNVVLKVYSDDLSTAVGSFDFEDIKLGGGENFYVKNLLLTEQSSSIEFRLTTETSEPNKENNILKLEV